MLSSQPEKSVGERDSAVRPVPRSNVASFWLSRLCQLPALPSSKKTVSLIFQSDQGAQAVLTGLPEMGGVMKGKGRQEDRKQWQESDLVYPDANVSETAQRCVL